MTILEWFSSQVTCFNEKTIFIQVKYFSHTSKRNIIDLAEKVFKDFLRKKLSLTTPYINPIKSRSIVKRILSENGTQDLKIVSQK